MNLKHCLEEIENGGCVFNIGQIEAGALKQLNTKVRAGEIARIKSMWPWYQAGTILKTAYCLPENVNHFKKRIYETKN